MGSRNPSNIKMGWTGFSAQFEWDAERWLFRRGGRAAPVEISREEMVRSIAIYENWTLGLIALFLLVFLAGSVLLGTTDDGAGGWTNDLSPYFAGAVSVLLPVLVLILGCHMAGRFATRTFNGREPQGPTRSRMEVRQAWVQKRSWRALLGFPAFFLLLAGLNLWRDGAFDLFWICIAVLFVVITAFDAWLKLRVGQLQRPH